ncbi:unnamed protein product [marine sediment metagenome]|uniref:Uncharacterized protein n=1 Tax=marine sediment metagenome TaxID=412755 RepID=X1K1X1_9ZZZZ
MKDAGMNVNKIAQFLSKPAKEFTKQDLLKFIEGKKIDEVNYK